MSIILAILGKVGFGAISGFAASLLNGGLELFKKRQDNKFELAKMDSERETQKLEIAMMVKIEERKAEAQENIADSEALVAAHTSDMASYSSTLQVAKLTGQASSIAALMMFFIDFYRGTVRPTITYVGCGFLGWMVYKLLTLVPLPILMENNPKAFWGIYTYTIESAVFLVSAAGGYWFGNRAKKFMGDK